MLKSKQNIIALTPDYQTFCIEPSHPFCLFDKAHQLNTIDSQFTEIMLAGERKCAKKNYQ
jgi:hypothetical protein